MRRWVVPGPAYLSPALSMIVAILCLTIPAVSSASDEGQAATGTSIQNFLTPDGRFDLEAARRSGFEGSLDLDGLDVRFDPRNGEPTFSGAIGAGSPADDPDDIYWDNSISPSVGGIGGIVYAATVYNGSLVVGGDFQDAGDVIAYHIASWDGTAWSPLGLGMSSGGSWVCVYALTVYNGNLIAGGSFTTAGGTSANRIASWDGTAWSPLGSGMGGYDPYVRALTVYNGNLIAGGFFTTAGGTTANYIASWDGTAWSPLGSGMNSEVRALTVYNGDLIAGGWFTIAGGKVAAYLARWTKLDHCCLDRVGDANGIGGDEPTIGDVSVMIDAKFITGTCEGILECLAEADINQSGGSDPTCSDITIGDISVLIDYLFITGPSLSLPSCL